MIQHTFGLLFKPSEQWRTVANMPESSQKLLVLYPFIFAIFPAIAWYWGTSQVGWTVGSYNEVVKLTEASALQVNILFYCVMVASIAIIGYFIHWMSDTYGAENSTIAKGIIIADTKFEFGLDTEGRLHLIDEVLTPDSSRFWPAETWAPGISPPSFDKQFVRDYLETLDWDKTAPGPWLPDEVAAHTAEKYREAERLLTR